MFELLFLLVVLASAASLLAAGVSALRGHTRRSVGLLGTWCAGLAVYLGVLVTVSFLSPQQVIALGEDHCFDDWCVAVEGVTIATAVGTPDPAIDTAAVPRVVELRLSNRARGRDQRAASVAVHLIDDRGVVYDPSPEGQAALEGQRGALPPLTATIPLGGTIRTAQAVEVPIGARGLAVYIEHPVGPSPGWFVIGDDSSLLHRPAIVPLP